MQLKIIFISLTKILPYISVQMAIVIVYMHSWCKPSSTQFSFSFFAYFFFASAEHHPWITITTLHSLMHNISLGALAVHSILMIPLFQSTYSPFSHPVHSLGLFCRSVSIKFMASKLWALVFDRIITPASTHLAASRLVGWVSRTYIVRKRIRKVSS